MNKTFIAVLAFLAILFPTALALVSVKPVNAEVQNNPEGAWNVTGKGASGSVGSIVPIEFSITYVLDRCTDVNVYIETVDEARQKISFVGATAPVNNQEVAPEHVAWPETEFENNVAMKYRVNARIDQGVVGDEIDGFSILAECSGKSIFRGIVEDISVKVVDKKPESSPKPAKAPTVLPAMITSSAYTSPLPTSMIISVPAASVKPSDSKNDKVKNDTNSASDILSTVTPQPFETAPPMESPPLPPKQSFFGRFASGISGRFHTVANWFFKFF